MRSLDAQPTLIWIESLIEIAEQSALAPIYALLKRPDERHVTMQASDNSVFVQDVVRNVAVRLRDGRRVAGCRVRVVNEVSIHTYGAFARIE